MEALRPRDASDVPRPERPASPNRRLWEFRSRLGLSTRDVSKSSQRIAEDEGNPEFHISNAWLTQIENSDAIPGIHKLFSLSIIYRLTVTELFSLFGIDLTKLHQLQLRSRAASTHLTKLDVADPGKTVEFPVRFGASFDGRHTILLSRMVAAWGQVPMALIEGLDVRKNLYGYIGLEDYMLYPLLRPGSFVQIDPTMRTIVPRGWTSEYERPIYFLELREGYCCSWCERQERELFLLPHPLSPCKTRRLVYGVEAEIVGRVTGAGVSFINPPRVTETTPLRLPKNT